MIDKQEMYDIIDVLEIAVAISDGSKNRIRNAFDAARSEVARLDNLNPASIMGKASAKKRDVSSEAMRALRARGKQKPVKQ